MTDVAATPDAPLWTPTAERSAAAAITVLLHRARAITGRPMETYEDLRRWSVEDVGAFWELAWEDLGILGERGDGPAVDDPRRMPGARWFEGATLSFPENLLRHEGPQDAIVFRGERMHESRRISRDELRAQVAALAAALREMGVARGDRVCGFMPNLPETVIAMLAATSLGAIWSSCSPDFGVKGVLDRFQRIEPKVVFTAEAYSYAGRTHDSLQKMRGILEGLAGQAEPPRVVVVPYLEGTPDVSSIPGAVTLPELVAPHAGAELRFERLPFDHPLYIMYSSGTTGLPKCIVQSAGGILLNQLKEHRYHVDLGDGDRLFYFTTCGWMMWNWLVAGLGVGATIVLFDGSPFHPDPSSLVRLAADEGVTAFGASAKYFDALEDAGVKPGASFDLAPLRTVLSTGSPLSSESFDFVYRDVKPDVLLASISGGTDLNGCFVGGCPLLPVYRGDIQCRQLAMDVHAWDDAGQDVVGETGELVCTQAFPSMPLFFWGDEDGAKYRAAYFERFPGVWTHGDFCSIDERGGVRIYGRSDATLNPGGVRLGTSEIYRLVEAMDEVDDSVVIGQEWEGDQRVVLFVKLAAGAELTPELVKRIRTTIRSECSPRHVPARIVAVDDVPYTISMKKVELAVRDVVHGREVKNQDALKNPEALACYRDRPELAE